MLLSNHIRIRELVQTRSKNQQRLRQLNIELNDLKRYAEHIADGKISLWEMMKTPTSMFNRQTIYNQYSSIFCEQSANNQMMWMQSSPYFNQYMTNPQMQDPNVMMAYQQMMYKNFYEEAQKEFARQETELLHEKEAQIMAEKDSLTVENQAIETELQGLREQRKNDIQQTFNAQA